MNLLATALATVDSLIPSSCAASFIVKGTSDPLSPFKNAICFLRRNSQIRRRVWFLTFKAMVMKRFNVNGSDLKFWEERSVDAHLPFFIDVEEVDIRENCDRGL